MNTLVGGETGFRRSGIVYLCRSPEELAKREAWLDQVGRPMQLDTRLITRDEAARVLPGLAGPWLNALYTPSDGRAEPAHAAPAIAQAARSLGATILTRCAVRGVETAGGRIAAVVTEKGRIACDSVVLAGGVWSRLFCRPMDLRLPQLKVLSSVMRTEPLQGGPEASTSGFGFGLRKRLDGGYTVASWSGNVADIVPDSLVFFRDFLPALRMRRGDVRIRFGGRFFRELMQKRRWDLDQPSPFEAIRVLDPPVHQADPGPGARACDGGVSGVSNDAGRAKLGRHDRCDARWYSGDLRRRCAAGVFHRHRVHRAWFRHRARRGPLDGGTGDG